MQRKRKMMDYQRGDDMKMIGRNMKVKTTENYERKERKGRRWKQRVERGPIERKGRRNKQGK